MRCLVARSELKSVRVEPDFLNSNIESLELATGLG
jgi:hypothetical protein